MSLRLSGAGLAQRDRSMNEQMLKNMSEGMKGDTREPIGSCHQLLSSLCRVGGTSGTTAMIHFFLF